VDPVVLPENARKRVLRASWGATPTNRDAQRVPPFPLNTAAENFL
jgi:hypothetical protein